MLDRNFTQIWSTVKISWKGKVFSPVPISWSMVGIVAKCQNVIVFFPKHYYETSTVTKLLAENFVLVSFPRREWYFKIFAWTLNNNNNDCYYFSLSFILITLCIKIYIDYYFTSSIILITLCIRIAVDIYPASDRQKIESCKRLIFGNERCICKMLLQPLFIL